MSGIFGDGAQFSYERIPMAVCLAHSAEGAVPQVFPQTPAHFACQFMADEQVRHQHPVLPQEAVRNIESKLAFTQDKIFFRIVSDASLVHELVTELRARTGNATELHRYMFNEVVVCAAQTQARAGQCEPAPAPAAAAAAAPAPAPAPILIGSERTMEYLVYGITTRSMPNSYLYAVMFVSFRPHVVQQTFVRRTSSYPQAVLFPYLAQCTPSSWVFHRVDIPSAQTSIAACLPPSWPHTVLQSIEYEQSNTDPCPAFVYVVENIPMPLLVFGLHVLAQYLEHNYQLSKRDALYHQRDPASRDVVLCATRQYPGILPAGTPSVQFYFTPMPDFR